MERRDFLRWLGAGVLAGPLAAEARSAVPRVGVIHAGGAYVAVVEGLREGLKPLGLEEPGTLVLQVRQTGVAPKTIEAAVEALTREKVVVICAIGTTITRSAKRAAGNSPVVFAVGTDPVTSGFVQSFAKPEGRLTGVHYLTTDLTAKRLEILKGILPKARSVVIFYNPNNPTPRESVKLARKTVPQLHLELVERHVTSQEDVRASIRALKPGEVDAFFYVSDVTVGSQAQVIIDAARAIRLPTMFHERTAITQGALASYGVNYHEIGRLMAKYVQQILGGAGPGDLPVENIDRLELGLNLRTARDLGLTIPPAMVVRADHLIK
jgi:putative ABC transport system substrate-binding protein